jgi:hypothetical protein
MSACYREGNFKRYFDENMAALGLPVPNSMFDTYQTAVATASTILGALSSLGKGATMAELAGATIGLEKLAVLGAISAAGYAGAAIGSIAVASGRSLGCGASIADLFAFMGRTGLGFDGWHAFYTRHPEVLNGGQPFRDSYAIRAKSTPQYFEVA